VIQRIRTRGVSEAEIRAFVAAGFRDPESLARQPAGFRRALQIPAPFERLFQEIWTRVGDEAARLIALPDGHPYWAQAPRHQNFEAALLDYLESERGQHPEDETVLWSLAGIDVQSCDNDFGRRYWLPLCVRNPANVRYLVESAAWVLAMSGTRTSASLAASLGELKQSVPGLKEWLEHASLDGTDPGLQKASRIALSVVKGAEIPETALMQAYGI